MKLSWEWKLCLLNTFCQSIFFIYTSMSLLIALHTTLPAIYNDNPSILFNRSLLAVVIALNIVGNYFCIKFKSKYSVFSHQPKSFVEDNNSSHGYNSSNNYLNRDPSASPNWNGGSRNGLNNKSAPNLAGWTECRHCNGLVPPRTKHCALCRSCILKRDHHCFFAGCCIGFHNQRYFINFCLYGSLGAIYSAFATSTYLKSHYVSLQDWGIIAYFLPLLIFFWVNGSASGTVVLFVLFLYWSTFTSILCFYFFTLQVFLVFRGQTKHESKKKIFTYRSNFLNNIMSVFGPGRYCFISFLLPVPCIGYFGDGKSWDELNHENKIA